MIMDLCQQIHILQKKTFENEYIDMVNYKQMSSDELVMRVSMSL